MFVRGSKKTKRKLLGDAGEDAAAHFLKKSGYKILCRNWRNGRDEIDLVALAPGATQIVFVEVKTRAASDSKGGYHAVDARKRAALARAVRAYLRSVAPAGAPFRFDIAEVRAGENDPGNPDDLRVIHHCAVPLLFK